MKSFDLSLGFARRLQHEDVLLALTLLVEPLLQQAFGLIVGGASFLELSRDSPRSALIGLVMLAAVAGALAALATRTHSDPDDGALDMESPRGYAYFPMIAALPMVFMMAREFVSFPGQDTLIGLTAVFPIVALLVHRWLPALPRLARRVLMTPFILVCAWIFSSLLDSATVGLLQLGTAGGASILSALGGVFGLILLAGAVFYMMFVFAPRQISGDDSSWADWNVRFAVYFIGVMARLVLPRVLGGA